MGGGKALQHINGFINQPLARPRFSIAVIPCPDLIPAQFMNLAVRDVADPVVGELGNVGIAKRRAVLYVDSQLSEQLGGNSDSGDVPDANPLQPTFLGLATMRGEMPSHIAKHFNDLV